MKLLQRHAALMDCGFDARGCAALIGPATSLPGVPAALPIPPWRCGACS